MLVKLLKMREQLQLLHSTHIKLLYIYIYIYMYIEREREERENNTTDNIDTH